MKIKGICNVTSVSKTYDGSASVTLPKANLAFLDAAGNMISLPESAYTITDARFTTRQDDLPMRIRRTPARKRPFPSL